jgi:glycosyltransferase involved in cell wall biosynthesis
MTNELIRKAGHRVVVYTSSQNIGQSSNAYVKRTGGRLSPDRGSRGNLERLLWAQTVLPARLMRDKAKAVFSPIDEGMFFPFIPQVITCWDIIALLYPDSAPRRRYYYRYIMPRVLRGCKAIICGSENTLKDIRREYRLDSKPMHVVYPSIDRQIFHPVRNPSAQYKFGLQKFVLYVGDMRPYKNLQRAIAAFSKANLPNHKFVIVGKKDNNFYPQVRQYAAELEMEDRVIFTGYLPTELLPQMYSAADVFVFPSLYEGFGLPPLEAMACGTPVVAAKASSIPEACGDAAFYVDPHQVDSIAKGLYEAVNNGDLRQKLIEKGYQRVRMFSWSDSADKVLQVMDDIC